MLFVKLHKSYRNVIAMCDSDLIGKKLEENFEGGTKQLDIRESFYKGKEIPYSEAIKIIKFQSNEDSTFNLVGKETIKAAIDAGIIDDNGVGKVDGVPYALVLL